MKEPVVCYAGAFYPEKPRTVIWEGQLYIIKNIIQRRKTPEGVGFLVQCSPDEVIFDLFYFDLEARWQIQPR